MFEQMHVSISELQQQANKGDAKAQFDLAWRYSLGINVDRNEEIASMWLNKSANKVLLVGN